MTIRGTYWRERTRRFDSFRLRVSNFGLKGKTMKRIWIDSLDVNLKSAFRNFKSAILLCSMLFALCLPAAAQQPAKVFRIGYLSSPSFSVSRPASRSSDKVCASSEAWRGKTLSLSIDLQREN